MPWLDLATRVNPQNQEGYLVAAFWLAGEAQRPELALGILDNAQCNIPYAYEVQLEKGRILLHTGEHRVALQAFSAAIAFWEKTADPTDPDQLLDKAEALLYRALLREAEGMPSEAIADLKAMLSISPDRPAMQARLRDLESGTTTHPPAHALLRSMLRTYQDIRRQCDDPSHAHEETEHEHHEGCGHDNQG
jgi:tetratricopeptide (TPR) repeat protein